MPSTTGLKLLVRTKLPSEKAWLELIEARRQMLSPHLDTITLPRLGDLECLASEGGHHHNLWENSIPEMSGADRFSLHTQGVFKRPRVGAVEYFPETGFAFYDGSGRMKNGRLRIWGLTRANEWLLVTVEFVGEPGYKGRGRQRAVKIDLDEVDLPTLLAQAQLSPLEVWQELGAQIKRTYQAREALAARLRGLAQMVEIEELALSVSQGT